MAGEQQEKDNWTSKVCRPVPCKASSQKILTVFKEYQHSAAFVPKLATKVVSWLDIQKDDVILDVGCGGRPAPEPIVLLHFHVY